MSITEKQKNEGLRRMKALCDYFNLGNKLVNYLKNGKLYYSYGYSMDKITYDSRYPVFVENFERQYNGYVYHVIEANTQFGKMLSFLYVSNDEAFWETECLEHVDNAIMSFSFILEDDNDDCWFDGEIGSIGLKAPLGYLARAW